MGLQGVHVIVHGLTILCAILALGWLWHAIAALRGMPTLPDLGRPKQAWIAARARDGNLDKFDLTVVVPACNEEAGIDATLRSLLASSGVRLQIVAVDDRSTDRTGEVMDKLAAESAWRDGLHVFEVIHVRELPQGWLGKTHALAMGAARARAPWMLFTDGDVRFDPEAVKLALGYAEAEAADHVVLVFTMEFKSFAEGAVLAAFQALAGWNIRLWKVADPKARDFFGAGGFNMIRRGVLKELGGLEGLRMEVLEDLRLGWKVKRAGYRQRLVLGAGLARIRWIEGALGIVGLLEKNGFAVSRYRVGLALLGCVGLGVQAILPLAAMACGGWAAVTGIATYLFIGMSYFAGRRLSQASPWLALLFAPATAVLLFAVARSMILALKRGGVMWRGTLYPLAELRRSAGRGW